MTTREILKRLDTIIATHEAGESFIVLLMLQNLRARLEREITLNPEVYT